MDIVSSLFSAGKNKVAAICQRIAPGPTQRIQRIWGGVVGRQILQPVAAEYVGATIGGAFPQLTIGAHAAEAIANRAEPTHAVEDIDNGQEVVISSTKSRKWKVIFGFTAIAAAGGITWILSKMTGSSEENPTTNILLGQMVLSTAGSIVGGMQALRLSGSEVPENYTKRSVQYYGACKGFNMVRHLVLVPKKLRFITGTIGATGELLAGTAGYHAQSLVSLYKSRRELTHHSHDKLLKAGITIIYGSVPQMAQEIVSNVAIAPLITMIAQQSLALGIVWTVDNRTVSNLIARSFNEYVRVVRTNPNVQKAIENFRAAYPERCEGAKRALIRTLQHEVGVRRLGRSFQPQMQNLAEFLVQEIPKWEENLLGFSLSSREDSFHQEMKKIHLMVYLTFVVQKWSSRRMRADLPPAMQRTLYSNGARMLLSAYEAPRPVTEAAVEVLDQALPYVIPNNLPRPPSRWQGVAHAVKHGASRVWKTLRSSCRFVVSHVPRVIASKVRRIVRSIFDSIRFAWRTRIADPVNRFVEAIFPREFELQSIRRVRRLENPPYHRHA